VEEGKERSRTDNLLGWYGPAHSKLSAQVTPWSNVLAPSELPAVPKPTGEIEGIPV
jgi:hypothetical protein